MALLLCVASAEATSRFYWSSLHYGAPFGDPSRVLYTYYPELRRVDRQSPSRSDDYYDVLFLGGSVLERHWGQVENELLEQLAYAGRHNVRVFNLAQAAHTSRDSRLKYAAVGDARFDLVIFYHGINDARANNAPPEVFREDYSHYSWYWIVNILASYHGTARFALPYTLHYAAMRIQQMLAKHRLVPTHKPPDEWLRYGADARSAAAFESNLGAILDAATRRGDPVMLMSFATYVPDDYSHEAFMKKRLDYGLHREPIEKWGHREHVVATVASHNESVRTLATQHQNVFYVDQASLMAGAPRYFNDICHLTNVGSREFIENLLEALSTGFWETRGVM